MIPQEEKKQLFELIDTTEEINVKLAFNLLRAYYPKAVAYLIVEDELLPCFKIDHVHEEKTKFRYLNVYRDPETEYVVKNPGSIPYQSIRDLIKLKLKAWVFTTFMQQFDLFDEDRLYTDCAIEGTFSPTFEKEEMWDVTLIYKNWT